MSSSPSSFDGLPSPAAISVAGPAAVAMPVSQIAAAAAGSRGLGGRRPSDWLFALAILGAAVMLFSRLGATMDIYEQGILLGFAPALIWLGWSWRPLQALMIGLGATAAAMHRLDTDTRVPSRCAA